MKTSNIILIVCLFSAVGAATASTNAVPRLSAATLLQNGDFESTNSLQGWMLMKEFTRNGGIGLDVSEPLNAASPHSLKLTVTNSNGRCTIASLATPMQFTAGTWYDLTFSARSDPTNRGFGLVVSLETADGKKVCGRATIPEIGGSWKEHMLAIPAIHSTSNGRLSIELFEVGSVWLDNVSLAPRKASE